MSSLLRASTFYVHTVNGSSWSQPTFKPCWISLACIPSSSCGNLSPIGGTQFSSDPRLPMHPRLTTYFKKLKLICKSSSSFGVSSTFSAEPTTPEDTAEALPTKPNSRMSFLLIVSKLSSFAIVSIMVLTIALTRKGPRSTAVLANTHIMHLLKGLPTLSGPTLSSPSELQLSIRNEDQLPGIPSHCKAANELESGVVMIQDKHMSSSSLFFASTTLSGTEDFTNVKVKGSKNSLEETGPDFFDWVSKVKADAVNRGVSEGVLEWALQGITVSAESVTKGETMPEVTLTLDAYLKRMVDERRISSGSARLKENLELLSEISEKYGVPSQILVSIWGIETSYGSYMGEWDIIQSLATMGFTEELMMPGGLHLIQRYWSVQRSRQTYFRGELIEALAMVEKGTGEVGIGPQGNKRLRGSWAGAMGQCQFMPTTFREYAVDYDGDGHKDIWESKADIFASIANFLKKHGWKDGGPLYQKVQTPKKLEKELLRSGVVKSVADWERLHDVRLDPGYSPRLPPSEMVNLVIPNGPNGQAYLVCNNFRVILRYNSKNLYGFAVCELARLIQERASTPYPTPPL